MRIIALIFLAIAALTAIACRGSQSEPTPDIDATVEARVQEIRMAEAAIDATVEARVKGTQTAAAAIGSTVEAQVTATPALPHPTATPPRPTPTRPPTATPFPTATPRPTPIRPPTATPFPTATPLPTPTPIPKPVRREKLPLKQYANESAGAPGAIYAGDLTQLVGPAPYYIEDNERNVPLDAIQQHKWIFESDYYQSLLERARVTNPTELVSQGKNIILQYVCINRALPQCRHIQTFFVPNVEARTNGQIKIHVTSHPELGVGNSDIHELLSSGHLEMAEISGAYLGYNYPTLTLQNLWGLWPDHRTYYEAQVGIVPDQNRMITEETGSRVLMRNWIGDDHFLISRKRLETPGDFGGLKTSSYSAELTDWVEGMGAEPMFVAYVEVYFALKRGIVDARVTGARPSYWQGWYDVAEYMNGPLYNFNSTITAINHNSWESIPADLQQILIEESAKHELEALRLSTIQNLSSMRRNIDAGLEFVEFSPEVKARSFHVAYESVLPNFFQRISYLRDVVDVFNNKIGPYVGLSIEPDGSVEKVSITKGPHVGKTMEQVLSE